MHDLVTLGEVMLRLAVPSPARFETARQLDVQIGGAEANVAAACARLGLRCAWISALPTGSWGERVRRELGGHGVDCGFVRLLDGARMGLYFVEHGAPPRPIRVLYDRRDSAFARLTAAEVDWAPLRQARVVHLTGITPALGPASRALVDRALGEAKALSFDVNYRSALWSPAEARDFVDTVLPRARFFFVGLAEADLLWGLGDDPERVASALAKQAPGATVTVLMGEGGCLTLDGGRLVRASRRFQVQMVDPIGAGDAFVGGFLWAALRRVRPSRSGGRGQRRGGPQVLALGRHRPGQSARCRGVAGRRPQRPPVTDQGGVCFRQNAMSISLSIARAVAMVATASGRPARR